MSDKDRELIDKGICPACGGTLRRAEGCIECPFCGWSACNEA